MPHEYVCAEPDEFRQKSLNPYTYRADLGYPSYGGRCKEKAPLPCFLKLTEGETDCFALHTMQVCSTCNSARTATM